MRLALLVAAAGIAVAMAPLKAAPSFDCSRAQSVSEREVCRVPELQWFDRQLAHLYNDVKGKGPQVVADQRTFLTKREACGTNLECLEQVYQQRLKMLGRLSDTADPIGEFKPTQFGGDMWVVRYGGVTGAIELVTVGGGGSTCVFETDNATQTGKGVLKAVDASEGETCRLNVIPNGNDLDVETHGCQSFCGMRAIMNGPYRRVGP